MLKLGSLLLLFLLIMALVGVDCHRHHRRRHRRHFLDAVNRRSVGKPEECVSRVSESSAQRVCQRKCVSDHDCLNERKLCLCDGICGLSCIRPEKECPELPDPPHGQVHLTGRHFNDRAAYTCHDGYQLVGLDEVLCLADGRWSSDAPSCRRAASRTRSRYYCTAPKAIQNARHNGSDDQAFFDLDTDLVYTCEPGFRREGFQEAQCYFFNGSATWFGPDLRCLPVDCGSPTPIINGRHVGDCTTYRCQVHYECVAGFELVGKSLRYCQSDGTWTPNELPTCLPVQCPLPQSPNNGRAKFTAVAYKSVVTYECDYGYMVVGNATRTCGEKKDWSGGEPRCGEINCGSPGFLANGWLEGSRTTLHAVITFRCNDGMTFEGESFTTTCQDDGTWSYELPSCHAPCHVPEIGRGRVLSQINFGAVVQHGQHISVECDDNFDLAGIPHVSVNEQLNETSSRAVSISCVNGSWSRIPECRPAACRTLPTPPINGMVVAPRASHGGVGLFQCKDGFRLVGSNRTVCRFGKWRSVHSVANTFSDDNDPDLAEEPRPRCELVFCAFPGYVDNGKVLLVGNMGLYDYRPYVRKVKNNRQILFECKKGFMLEQGPPGATCIDGRWSPSELPRCVGEFHPRMGAWKRRRKRSINDFDKEFTALSGRRRRRLPF